MFFADSLATLVLIMFIALFQLEVLTNIPSAQEPSGKFSCTFGVLQDRLTPENVHHKAYPAELVGHDSWLDGRNGSTRLRRFGFFIFPLLVTLIG